MIDTHAHLNLKPLNSDIESVITRAWDNNISHIVNIGLDVETSSESIELTEKYPVVSATCGIHPNTVVAPGDICNSINEIEKMLDHPKVVAVGEIGLDYYRDYVKPEIQKSVFIDQLNLAQKKGMPVVIHIRDAHEDFISIFKKYRKLRGVLHAFSGDEDVLNWVMDNTDLYIGIGGPVTFKNFKNDDLIRKIPLDRILLETDCPYLAPEPYRGKTNEPAFIPLICQRLAEIFEISISEMEDISNQMHRAFSGCCPSKKAARRISSPIIVFSTE